MWFNCLKATATSRRQFTFYHSVPRNSWYSFYQPRKDERLSRPWSHPVVLNRGPLDRQSSTLTAQSISNLNISNPGLTFSRTLFTKLSPESLDVFFIDDNFCAVNFASEVLLRVKILTYNINVLIEFFGMCCSVYYNIR